MAFKEPAQLVVSEATVVKGIVFNLLEGVVTKHYGANTWDSLLAAAEVDGVYTSLGNYPDEELVRLMGAASAALNLPLNAVIRWFGTEAIPLLVHKYPGFFTKHQATRPFLLTINGIIHPEVRKLYPGADVPDFDLDASSPEVLVMGYYSKRQLCAFAEGLIRGAAAHCGEKATIAHPSCMHRGDASCRLVWVTNVTLEISFPRRDAAREAGLSGAFALPVLVGPSIPAVLEFFTVDAADPEETWLNLAAQVGTQLGRIFERKRAAEERSKPEEQFLRVQRVEAVGTLASGIAHDLNNILAPVLIRGWRRSSWC